MVDVGFFASGEHPVDCVDGSPVDELQEDHACTWVEDLLGRCAVGFIIASIVKFILASKTRWGMRAPHTGPPSNYPYRTRHHRA